MILGALIIDNRPVDKNVFHRHCKFLPEDCPIIHLNKEPINSAHDYNLLMTSLRLWQKLPFEKVLIFQHDSGLLKEGIEQFLEYDFIGAPIYNMEFPRMNGGLSLRSRDAMVKIIKDHPYDARIHGNEDIYFCDFLEKDGFKLPTKDVAASFSVETLFSLGSLGWHAIDKYQTPEHCKLILNQYVERTK
jgi:hypothetical protein